MKVAKFGGSSLADAEQMKKVCEIVLSDKERRLVVVSAPGKRYKEDTKVTDLLIELGEVYLSGSEAVAEMDAVVSRFHEIVNDLDLPQSLTDEIKEDLKARLAIGRDKPEQLMDALKAAGEDNNAKIVAKYLQSLGHEAQYINPKDAGMLLSDEYGNAQVLPEAYPLLAKLKEKKGVSIFPGFFGYTTAGVLATFPRGGSDITGAILAAAVQADTYENFTDVDSVYAANPNIVSNPKPIQSLTYREMRELSYGGFSVLQEETLAPVFHAKIPVNIKNTNNPSAIGTFILPEVEEGAGGVTGIASDSGFCFIYVSKYLMNREIGFGRKLLSLLEDVGVPFEHMPSGVDDLSLIVRNRFLSDEKMEILVKRIYDELGADKVVVDRDIALIIIVGEGMSHHIGIAAKATNAIAEAGVNIEMINQGSSEISMMFGVKAKDEKKAVCAIYSKLLGKK